MGINVMNGLNRLMLIGYLDKKPEVRYTMEGETIANFTLVTSSSLAEICKELLDKGSRVYLEGKLRTRKWQDKKGVDRFTIDNVGSKLKMLVSRD
jgi:single-strand DNA-binding protein